MYLAPEGEELEIASAAASFLRDAIPADRLHGPNGADLALEARARLGEMGWFGLSLPEIDGGSDLSPVEHALFFREVGRQCGPIDILAQSLAASVGGSAIRRDIIDGSLPICLIIPEDEGYRAIGARDAKMGLFVDPNEARLSPLAGASFDTRPSLDPCTTQRVFAKVPAPIEWSHGKGVWQLGQLGCAAMLVGIAEAALDLIVDYAKIRETFGRKIGTWQAVRHPCADMAVRTEAARCQLWFAAAALKENRSDAAVHLDVAKHLANLVALGNADATIQLHGGIGVTEEHSAHLLLKHTLLLSRLFGTKRRLLADLLHARLED